MSVLVGIDGGGTKTRAIAYRKAGGAWRFGAGREGIAGPCNIAILPPQSAAEAINEAVAATGAAAGDVAAICAAVAGYSFASRREPFRSEVARRFPAATVVLVPDYIAAFRAAFDTGRGVVVIAGTGSVAYGADGGARSHRAGAYGYLIDDAGSGYGLGRAAIAAALQALDGTGEATVLSKRIAEATGMREWDGIIEAVYGGAIDRVGIAGLARVVAGAAAEGDEVARKLLMRTGGALAHLADASYRAVFGDEPAAGAPVAFALSGSLWHSGSVMTDVFTRSANRFAPGAAVRLCETDPAVGAARLAAEALGVSGCFADSAGEG